MTAYIVQSVQSLGTTTSTLSGTMAPIRPGNCLVVIATSQAAAGNNGSASAVTLNGAADNWTSYVQSGNNSSAGVISWWADPSSAGSTNNGTISVTWAGITGSPYYTSFTVAEVGGLMPYTASLVDVSGTQQATAVAWNSGTINTQQIPDLIFGSVISTATPSAPLFPWITLSSTLASVAKTQQVFQATTALGAASYSGTFAASTAYNAGIVALQGLPVSSPTYPTYIAGAGPQQGDMNSLVTAPLGFAQQRVVFRAAQNNTTTVLPAGQPGTKEQVVPDTIYEDPYRGYTGGTAPVWNAPFTGWYMVHQTYSLGTCATDTILSNDSFGSLVMPAGGGGVVQYFDYIFATAGVSVSNFHVKIFGATNCSTSNSPPSLFQIYWLGYSAF